MSGAESQSSEIKVYAQPAVATTAPAPSVEKKKPGRPRKKPLRPPVERTGIVATPKRAEDSVEFIYSEPMMLKKVFGLFKAVDARELTITFNVREMSIVTSDHLQKIHILVTFDCAKMLHYYCAERLTATLNAAHIEKINQTLDKNNTMVTIISKRASARDSLVFVFQDDKKMDYIHEISLITPTIEHQCTPRDFDSVMYEINFKEESKGFKKRISNTNVFSDTFTIQKNGTGKLVFPHITEDRQIRSECIVQDPAAIELEATTQANDIFSVSVVIEYIKPIAAALLAETIRVYADRRKKMLFVSELDNKSIIVCVAANIVTAEPARSTNSGPPMH